MELVVNQQPTHPLTQSQLKVVAVIVTWNKRVEVLRCIESVLASTHPIEAIIILDNASTDGTAEAIKQQFDHTGNIYLLVNRVNKGGSGGFYEGINAALTYKPDYLWLLDNDVIVAPNALSELLLTAETEPGAGIVGSKIYFAQTPQIIWSLGARINFKQARAFTIGDKVRDEGQFQQTLEIDYVPMCSMLLAPKVVERIGSVDPGYFVYGDDVDFCTRARQAGFRVLNAPRSNVWHDITLNSGRLSPFAAYYFTRNRCHNVLKFTPAWYKPVSTGWLLIFLLRRLLATFKYWPGFNTFVLIELAVLAGFFDGWRGKRGKVY
jgi:GT2 family glycosyltransferase